MLSLLRCCSQSDNHPATEHIQKVHRRCQQKFSRSNQVALQMQLTDASPAPSDQMLATLLDFRADCEGQSVSEWKNWVFTPVLLEGLHLYSTQCRVSRIIRKPVTFSATAWLTTSSDYSFLIHVTVPWPSPSNGWSWRNLTNVPHHSASCRSGVSQPVSCFCRIFCFFFFFFLSLKHQTQSGHPCTYSLCHRRGCSSYLTTARRPWLL